MHFVEGGDGINGEDLLERRRIEDGTGLEPARIAFLEGGAVEVSECNDELLERGASVARPVERGDGPEGHVLLHVEGLRGVEAVERHVFLDDVGRIAALAADLPLLLGRGGGDFLLRGGGRLHGGRCDSGFGLGFGLRPGLAFLLRLLIVLSGLRLPGHDERLGGDAARLALDGGAFSGRRHDECAVLRLHFIGADGDGAACVHLHEKREAA